MPVSRPAVVYNIIFIHKVSRRRVFAVLYGDAKSFVAGVPFI